MRRFVIGDIHGNYLALKDLLDIINFDFENDQLISLGDVTDGWEQTCECIELLMKIKNLIFIKGNHDEWTTMYLRTVIENKMPTDYYESQYINNWYTQGGKQTCDSYLNGNNIHFLDKHLDFLENGLNYYIDDENNLFIHAGYHPMFIPIKDENNYHEDYLWTRSYVRDKVIHPYNNPQYKGDKNFNKVFIGHTPTINLAYLPDFKEIADKPIVNNNIYMLDTGAGFTGYLTCYNLDTMEYFQSSKTGWQYYPDTRGRLKQTFNEFIKNSI